MECSPDRLTSGCTTLKARGISRDNQKVELIQRETVSASTFVLRANATYYSPLLTPKGCCSLTAFYNCVMGAEQAERNFSTSNTLNRLLDVIVARPCKHES